MELAGLRVGNKEIRRDIDLGTVVFAGAMRGLNSMGNRITMPLEPNGDDMYQAPGGVGIGTDSPHGI